MTDRRKNPFFDRSSPARLIALTLILLSLEGFLWFQKEKDSQNPYNSNQKVSFEETELFHRVRRAQDYLWQELFRRGIELDPEEDVDKTGFIGVEWSPITTTLGSLESKRSACDPLWAVQTLRWFDRLGITSEDRIVVLSSASFPGMLFSVLAAAETRGLQIDLAVSLGASTWGANRPEAPWPVLEKILRNGGFLKTIPFFYTLGGGNGENGGGIFEEGITVLEKAVRENGGKIVRTSSFEATLALKMSLTEAPDRPKAKLLISIGGSETALGHDASAIALPPGLLDPGDRLEAGNGIIALALQRGYPVLHLLNLHALADRVNLDFYKRRPVFAQVRSLCPAIAGLLLFVFVLSTHKRWIWED
ncbi:MAG: poly-gamma-glutamate system protein [Synergistaceae bacterium]|jgi:poly-gamma-glutamate system protein|nr:poly-gamma-glutamate system protein [Synergistaceae bacterium]